MSTTKDVLSVVALLAFISVGVAGTYYLVKKVEDSDKKEVEKDPPLTTMPVPNPRNVDLILPVPHPLDGKLTTMPVPNPKSGNYLIPHDPVNKMPVVGVYTGFRPDADTERESEEFLRAFLLAPISERGLMS